MSSGVCSVDNTPRRIFLTTDAVGGVWNYTLTLASGFLTRGWQCVAATVGPDPSPAQREQAGTVGLELIETGLPLDWTSGNAAEVAATAANLADVARSMRADSVHLHTPSFAIASWHAPAVVVSHSCIATWWAAAGMTAIDNDLAWRKQVVANGIAQADCVVAPSFAFAREMIAVYGSIRSLKVVHNGAPLPAKRTEPRGRYGLCAGRLWDPGKNFRVLDAAAASLDFKMLAAGSLASVNGARFEPRYLESLGSLDAAGLTHHYREAAFFASPSRYEPFGLAVLEAAGHAMPLVLSDIPTFRELWDGAASFVCDDSPGAWTTALENLMSAPSLRAELGGLARARAASYTSDRMISAMYAIHQSFHNVSVAVA